jgi:hypothetical protein
MVEPIPQFEADAKVLRALSLADAPPKNGIRSKVVFEVGYGFGDSSLKRFGSILLLKGVVKWRSGQWTEDYEAESSNQRELENMTIALEKYAQKHHWVTVELFMFTGNFVTLCASFRESSTSLIMFGFVLRLRILDIRLGWKINVLDVAGPKMIEQGMGALS